MLLSNKVSGFINDNRVAREIRGLGLVFSNTPACYCLFSILAFLYTPRMPGGLYMRASADKEYKNE